MTYKLVPVFGRIVYDTASARATATNAVSKSQYEQNREANITIKNNLQFSGIKYFTISSKI